ncbi:MULTISPECIES: class I SAM-dependent methyltransferase [Bacillus]|uniref:Methyltransferase domain-containing protein n=1 Tax=Bacillus cereus TaxID=1396 RepID=A0ABD7DNN5_BACCE|nr:MULTISPECIES: methyltransferase domain-containing protein [Bacillus cereus group]MCU5457677.1 class I SAM-dependent methyltransferase [Bacillus cereus]MCU5512209.1 class I SAM-dependent methyltransferase [Bacillus cereus]MCU5550653.1 class I SAM-dependent methyltransferase [Bacillus cereus]MCU5623523.1 class I SAM-dependent methyltransferase [Bacillus cereus]MCU5679727.1 class I SAM-dependent methyltransferase [Bacillus cereus]
MTFYQKLMPYYDEIFPENEKQLNFIASYLQEGDSVIDVGAATGNVANALVEKGMIVTAMEPAKKMADKISEKAITHRGRLFVNTLRMQQIDDVPGIFDGIYCIGNTLVHLDNVQEISDFIQSSFKKLKKNGKFIVQIVNYEKVLNQKNFIFPVIKKEHFSFKRDYAIERNKVLFTVTLNTSGEEFSNSIELYPITKKQLLPILIDCGFESVETYANFDKKIYSLDGPALVIVATK